MEDMNTRASKKESTSFFNYLYFLNMYVLKRKPTIIVPIAALIFLLIFPTILMLLPDNDPIFKLTAASIFIPINFSVAWSFMILFGCMVTLTIFKEGKVDGIETLVVSKPITRQTIILAKFLYLLVIGIIYWLWIFLIFLSTLYMIRSQAIFTIFIDSNMNNFIFGLTFGLILIFFIFALISSFISIKVSVKNTISLVLITFPLLSIVGAIFSNPILFRNRPTETLFKIGAKNSAGDLKAIFQNPIINISPNGMVILNANNEPFTDAEIIKFKKAWDESSDAGILPAINNFINPTSMVSQAFSGEQHVDLSVSWTSSSNITSYTSPTTFDLNATPINANAKNNNVIRNGYLEEESLLVYKRNNDGTLSNVDVRIDIPVLSQALSSNIGNIKTSIDKMLKDPYNPTSELFPNTLALLYMRAYEVSSDNKIRNEYGIHFEDQNNLLNKILNVDFFQATLDIELPIIEPKSFIANHIIVFHNGNSLNNIEPFIYNILENNGNIINIKPIGFLSPTWGVMLVWTSVLFLLFILSSVYYYNEDFV